MTNILIIGLGGTGTKIIEETAESVEAIPAREGHQIRFRVVDFAWERERDGYFTLSKIPGVNYLLDVPDDPDYYFSQPEQGWMQVPWEKGADPRGGTGRTRCWSKALFNFRGFEQLRQSIYSDLIEMRQQTGSNDFVIFIISALGGGTGSGMFFDVAKVMNDVRKALIAKTWYLFGLFVLPSAIQFDRPGTPHYNTYAALKELWKVASEPNLNPFNLMFLLSLYKAPGITEAEKEKLVDRIVSRLIIDYFHLPIRAEELRVLDLNDFMNKFRDAPRATRFATCSVSHLYFPRDILDEYFGLKDLLGVFRKERMNDFSEKIFAFKKSEDYEGAKDRKYRIITNIRHIRELELEQKKAGLIRRVLIKRDISKLKEENEKLQEELDHNYKECQAKVDRIKDISLSPTLKVAEEIETKMSKYAKQKLRFETQSEDVRRIMSDVRTLMKSPLLVEMKVESVEVKDEDGRLVGVADKGTLEILFSIRNLLTKIVDPCENMLENIELDLAEPEKGIFYQYPIDEDKLLKLEEKWDRLRESTLRQIVSELEGEPAYIRRLGERFDRLRDGIVLYTDFGVITDVRSGYPVRVCHITSHPDNLVKEGRDLTNEVMRRLHLDNWSEDVARIETKDNLGVNFCYIVGGFELSHVKEILELRESYRKLSLEDRKRYHANFIPEGIEIWADEYDPIKE